MDLRELQSPLKQRYREEADSARITLEASASETDAPISCSVASLIEKTERYCTVLQTLREPPRVESDGAG